jgi:hypothetical protein
MPDGAFRKKIFGHSTISHPFWQWFYFSHGRFFAFANPMNFARLIVWKNQSRAW